LQRRYGDSQRCEAEPVSFAATLLGVSFRKLMRPMA
jgi:hypothetical protein